MILPGVSGGYLLLLLGQYETILGAIDTLKQGLLGGAGLGVAMQSLTVVAPVGVGVLAGIVGVSNFDPMAPRNLCKTDSRSASGTPPRSCGRTLALPGTHRSKGGGSRSRPDRHALDRRIH